MQTERIPLQSKSWVTLSDKKYLDDYELRLEQAENGIHGLTVDLSKIRSGLAVPDKSRISKSSFQGTLGKPFAQRDSRTYGPYDKLKSRSDHGGRESFSTSSGAKKVQFSTIERDFSRASAHDIEKHSALERDESPLMTLRPSHDNKSPRIKDTPLLSFNALTSSNIAPRIADEAASNEKRAVSCLNVEPSNKTYSPAPVYIPLKETIPARHTIPQETRSELPTDYSCQRSALHLLEKEAEQRLSTETEKIFKNATDELERHKLKLDDIYNTRLQTIREQVLTENHNARSERPLIGTKLAQMESQILDWRTKYDKLVNHYEDTLQQLNVYKTKSNRLETNKDSVESECQELQAKLTRVTNEKERVDMQVLHQKGLIDRLQCDLDNVLSLRAKDSGENRELQKSLSIVEQEKVALEKDTTALHSRLKEAETKLCDTTSNMMNAHAVLDNNNSTIGKLERTIRELQDDLSQKCETEAIYTSTIEQLKQQEYTLQQQIRVLIQTCEEKEDSLQDHMALVHQHEQVRRQLNVAQEDLNTGNSEMKRLTALNEKLTVDVRSCRNDNLLLSQENVKLRKENQELRQQTCQGSFINDFTQHTTEKKNHSIFKNSVAMKSNIHGLSSSIIRHPLGTERLGNHAIINQPTGLTHEHEGTDVTQTSQPSPFVTHPQSRSLSDLPSDVANLPYKDVQADALEKQLRLLEMEKTQLESQLGRCSRNHNGRQSERLNQVKLEKVLQQLDADVHRIKQELRFCGGLKRRSLYNYV